MLATLAIILASSGCATNDRIPPGAMKRFMDGLTTQHPLREGIVDNRQNFPVWVTIDDQPPKLVWDKTFDYFSITAKEPHHFVVRDGAHNIVKDEMFTAKDEPLGTQHYLPHEVVIDTGWEFPI